MVLFWGATIVPPRARLLMFPPFHHCVASFSHELGSLHSPLISLLHCGWVAIAIAADYLWGNTSRIHARSNLQTEPEMHIWGQFNKTFTLVFYTLDRSFYKRAKNSNSITVFTSQSYKCPTCSYRCRATPVECEIRSVQ